jgi:hypothetical protein
MKKNYLVNLLIAAFFLISSCTERIVAQDTGNYTAAHPTGIAEDSTEPTFKWSISESEITVRIYLASASELNIDLYNMLGKNIKALGSLKNVSGNYTETFSVNDIPKGIYFLAVVADNRKIVKRIIVD